VLFRSRGGPDDIVYTRDGRFTINNEHILVSVATGNPVLSEDGRVLRLDTGRNVTIHSDGRIEQDGGQIGQLRVRGISDTSKLRKIGNNCFKIDESVPSPRDLETRVLPQIEQGALEGSGVNAVQATLAVTEASRAASGMARLIQYFDGIMDSAINTLGRTS